MKNKIYIAGPMRGIKDQNFPAFLAAGKDLKARGYSVLCPATACLLEGYKPEDDHGDLTQRQIEKIITRDVAMVIKADGVVVLEGYEKSKGASVEVALARFLGKPVYFYPSMDLYEDDDIHCEDNDILFEALKITSGDRQNQYGPADQDFARTATMWGALKGIEFTTEEVAAFMICVKLSRNTHQTKRDNMVDIAGYARCSDLCRQEKEKRNETCTS